MTGLEPQISGVGSELRHNHYPRPFVENTHHRGKYHCTADFQFDWFRFDPCSFNISEAAESKQNKQEVSSDTNPKVSVPCPMFLFHFRSTKYLRRTFPTVCVTPRHSAWQDHLISNPKGSIKYLEFVIIPCVSE